MHHYAGYRIQLILFTMSITILVRIMTTPTARLWQLVEQLIWIIEVYITILKTAVLW